MLPSTVENQSPRKVTRQYLRLVYILLVRNIHSIYFCIRGQQGPLVRRLNSYGPLIGLVVGAFQEGSKDLHALLGTLADSQLRAKGLARGREGTDQERSIILAGLRRTLSMAAAKANSACLLDRVSRVGEEHRQAARRRAWVKREEERIQEERRAFWHANVRARGLNRGQMIT